MTIKANITFRWNQPAEALELIPSSKANPWRFLAHDFAVELAPICGAEAQKVATPPTCDRITISRVKWGYPQSLILEHPSEVEQMRQDHIAGKHDLVDGNYTWRHWLKTFGLAELWHRFRTPIMEKIWLNWRTNPGSTLSAYAGLNGRVSRAVCNNVKYRADFYLGAVRQTIFLASCSKVPLTDEERDRSPEFVAARSKLLERQIALENARIKRVQQERRTNKLSSEKVVSKAEVKLALRVKTDRAVRAIIKRHNFRGWPKTVSEMDDLVRKHQRSKSYQSEKMRARNRTCRAK